MNKKIITLAGVLFVFLVIGGVLLSLKPTITPKYTGPVETVRLSVSSAGVDLSTLIWIADVEGYFKDEGLNVEITQEANGVIAQEKVATGSADIATDSDFGFVSDSFNLTNLRILASIDQANVIDVVARRDKGINSPSDLVGKKVGLPLKLAPQYFFSQFLVSNGILPGQVNIINTPVADLQPGILSGKVDGIAINDPVIYDVKTALGSNGIDFPAQGGQDFSWLVISNSQFLQDHPEAANRLLSSLVMAENFVMSNPAKSKQIMESKFSLDPKYFDQNYLKHNFGITLDQSLLITLESQANWAIANKITAKTVIPNYLDFIYFDGLTKVKPGTVTIIH